ncbi:hypothetical protein F4778DRAFT_782599 [Xylariomycetidae sp. FL2044]|nr:hypothetical protein F4778DRAFT_782599 [Xylariomycetidae sp. FL2044]
MSSSNRVPEWPEGVPRQDYAPRYDPKMKRISQPALRPRPDGNAAKFQKAVERRPDTMYGQNRRRDSLGSDVEGARRPTTRDVYRNEKHWRSARGETPIPADSPMARRARDYHDKQRQAAAAEKAAAKGHQERVDIVKENAGFWKEQALEGGEPDWSEHSEDSDRDVDYEYEGRRAPRSDQRIFRLNPKGDLLINALKYKKPKYKALRELLTKKTYNSDHHEKEINAVPEPRSFRHRDSAGSDIFDKHKHTDASQTEVPEGTRFCKDGNAYHDLTREATAARKPWNKNQGYWFGRTGAKNHQLRTESVRKVGVKYADLAAKAKR